MVNIHDEGHPIYDDTNYTKILENCISIANERQIQYGKAEEGIQSACDIFNSISGIKLSVKDFCMVLVSLKLSRLKYNYKEDSMVDIINYVAIATASEKL